MHLQTLLPPVLPPAHTEFCSGFECITENSVCVYVRGENPQPLKHQQLESHCVGLYATLSQHQTVTINKECRATVPGCGLTHGAQADLGFASAAIGDIGSDGVAEEAGVLGHYPYLAAIPVSIQICQWHTIYQHLRNRPCSLSSDKLLMVQHFKKEQC